LILIGKQSIVSWFMNSLLTMDKRHSEFIWGYLQKHPWENALQSFILKMWSI
jgi:hypothetical protein